MFKKFFGAWLLLTLMLSAAVYASQNALVVPDGTGAAVRAGFNNAIDSLNTLESGPSAPATTEPYMLWCDTTNNLLKQRDSTNTIWIVLGSLGVTDLGLQPALPSGTSSKYLRGDLTMQALPAAGVPLSTGTGYGTSYQVGTAANDLVQLNSSGALPAVSGANLTNLPVSGGPTTQNVVTSSRALGTIYQNTTGKMMYVTASVNITGYTVQVLSDSNSTPTTLVAQAGPNNQYEVFHFLVLPGNYYEITAAYGLVCWTEYY